MGRKQKYFSIIKKINQLNNEKYIDELTLELIADLLKKRDEDLVELGGAFSNIRCYWKYKYEKLIDISNEDWNDLFDKYENKIDTLNLYINALTKSNTIYLPFFPEFEDIWLRNKDINILEDFSISKKWNKVLWEKNLRNKLPTISKKEINFLNEHGFNKMTQESAFFVLMYRYKEDIDFPFKSNINNKIEMQTLFEKFRSAYRGHKFKKKKRQTKKKEHTNPKS